MRERIVRPGDDLWLGHDIDPHAGFSVELLEQLATVKEREPWSSPWLYAPTEIYSFGRCYREWTGWPRWLPIPVYGDHGVVFEPTLAPHEERNPARIHLTFSVHRAAANRDRVDRRVLLVQHPWITHRHARGIRPAEDRRGTLFFASHSVPGIGFHELVPAALPEILDVADGAGPLVVMLHRHDIVRGLHRDLIAAGVPVVTAGNTTSPLFVDRFYAILTRFAAAMTDSAGSQVPLCEELGVPIRMAPRPLVNQVPGRSDDLKAAAIRAMAGSREQSAESAAMNARSVAAFGPDGTSTERTALTAELLGLGAPLDAAELRRTFRRELVATLVPVLRVDGPRIARRLLRRIRERSALRRRRGPSGLGAAGRSDETEADRVDGTDQQSPKVPRGGSEGHDRTDRA